MGLDRAISRQLCQTCYVASVTSVDSYGQPTYGTAVSVKARVEPEQGIVDGPNGEERQTSHRVLTASAVTDTDRIWLPADVTSPLQAAKARIPLRVDPCPDGSGTTTYHVVLV